MTATKHLLAGLLVLGAAALVLPAWAQGGGMRGAMGSRAMMGGGMGQGCAGMMQSMGAGGIRPNQQWRARRHDTRPEDQDGTAR